MNRKGISRLEIIIIVLLVAILAVLLFLAPPTYRRLTCAGNLKEIAKSLSLYAEENRERFPPIDDTKNNFIFDANLLYPEYLTDPMLAICPADPRRDPYTTFRLSANHPIDGTPKGEVHADCITDESYIYLGWMAMTDKEAEALFAGYDKLPLADYDFHIQVASGWGNAEGGVIYRLSAGCDRFLVKDTDVIQSFDAGHIVPIMWDRPYTDVSEFSHRPVGGNVLFLDGHVAYVESGERFPMTETMARLLEERPRAPIPYCE